uniref:Uncharacterized protein n=1 Tax=Populus trichocarpa TaxID=3694 RepID=A0A3N7E9P4_POPTR
MCRKLFEQLSLSGALAELTWPVIPNKREVILDFDPIANERKIALPNAQTFFLVSENSDQSLKMLIKCASLLLMLQFIDEFGSFIKHTSNFVNHKPIPIFPPSSSQDSKSRAHKQGHGKKRVLKCWSNSYILIHASGWTNK